MKKLNEGSYAGILKAFSERVAEMPHTYYPGEKVHKTQTFERLFSTLKPIFPAVTPLGSKGDRPLQMDFESELNALIFFHLEEHASARHLILTLKTDDFARRRIAPEKGIGKVVFQKPSTVGVCHRCRKCSSTYWGVQQDCCLMPIQNWGSW
jgi:hypothetical protein